MYAVELISSYFTIERSESNEDVTGEEAITYFSLVNK